MAPGQSRKLRVLPKALAGVAALVVTAHLPTNFVSPYVSFSRGRDHSGIARADGTSGDMGIQKWHKDQKWQHGLDAVFFDFDASLSERMDGIKTVFQNREAVVADMVKAAKILREKGPHGRQEALDMLFPKGTFARADIDSVGTLLDSVQKSIPDLTPELQRLRQDLKDLQDDVQAQVPDELKTFASEAAKLVLPIGVDLATAEAASDFRQIVTKEELSYLVVKKTREFEIRAYQPYAVARRTTGSMSEAFTDLTAYLKEQSPAAAMKASFPVLIEHAVDEAPDKAKSMTFPLEPKATLNLAKKNANVEVKKIPMMFVAVRRVGSATDAQAEEQLKLLREALADDGTYQTTADNRYVVMQYYSPRAAAWRRKTEIAVVVKAVGA